MRRLNPKEISKIKARRTKTLNVGVEISVYRHSRYAVTLTLEPNTDYVTDTVFDTRHSVTVSIHDLEEAQGVRSLFRFLTHHGVGDMIVSAKKLLPRHMVPHFNRGCEALMIENLHGKGGFTPWLT
jgi:hypothetical protein